MFTLPQLPYSYDALAPTVSANTLHFHHDKHHATYVKTLNQLLERRAKSPASLEDVIRSSAENGKSQAVQQRRPGLEPRLLLGVDVARRASQTAICAAPSTRRSATRRTLREAFVKAGAEHFGSGWVWLAAEGDTLKVIRTHDANDTVTDAGVTPLLVCDLWEHAYYLDYQNDRKRYLKSWFDTVANWRFAAAQWSAAEIKRRRMALPRARSQDAGGMTGRAKSRCAFACPIASPPSAT